MENTRFTMQLLGAEERDGVLVLDAVAAEHGPGGLPPGTPFTLALRYGSTRGDHDFVAWAGRCAEVAVSGAGRDGTPGLAFEADEGAVVLMGVSFTAPPRAEFHGDDRRGRFPWIR